MMRPFKNCRFYNVFMLLRLPCLLLLHFFAGGLFIRMRQHKVFCQLLETSLAFVQIAIAIASRIVTIVDYSCVL